MPLSPPSPRDPVHTRTIDCRGYRRADGLWDIEAHLVDTKSYAFPNHDRGAIAAGEPLHGMWLRITVDDDLLIHDAEAVTDHAPFRPCGDIAPAYAQLKGLRIGKGFSHRVRKIFAGPQGCTHLRELLRPLATTAYQTVYPKREGKRRDKAADERPAILDSCHALRSDGPVVAREWPAFYTGPQGASPTDSQTAPLPERKEEIP